MTTSRWIRAALSLVCLLAAGAPARGQDAGDIDQTVARVSFTEGDVAYARGDQPDDWQDVDRNAPMTNGDRLYTGGGRAELELQSGALLSLGPKTDVAALNLTNGIAQWAVNAGTCSVSVPRLQSGEVFEIDTPNAAVTLSQPGRYRIDVDESGETRVLARNGGASVAAGGGQIALESGEGIAITGTDAPRYDIVRLPASDGWDDWVDTRYQRAARARSYAYVSPAVVGAGDLDEYGRWETVPEYGRVWTPSSVAAGWAPYQQGHWCWQDPWGWTWISTEPWGWAPYHYGRWAFASSRWYWVPVAPAVRQVAYAPALVAFVGGPGGGVAIATEAPVVGWFPLAPRDPLVPWWGRPAAAVQVTNVTYVNRTYVTVVNQTTFVSGGQVSGAVIRESAAVRQIAAAPVIVGRVPVAPTVASTRVSVRPQAAAPRPPPAIAQRAVVTRSAPPPPPARFEQKLAVIQQNHAPVPQQESARLASAGAPARPAIAVRSAAADTVKLAPGNNNKETGAARRVEPVTSSAAPRSGAVAESRPQPAEAASRPAPPPNRPPDANRSEQPSRPQTQNRPPEQRVPQAREAGVPAQPTAVPGEATHQAPNANRNRPQGTAPEEHARPAESRPNAAPTHNVRPAAPPPAEKRQATPVRESEEHPSRNSSRPPDSRPPTDDQHATQGQNHPPSEARAAHPTPAHKPKPEKSGKPEERENHPTPRPPA